MDQVGQSHRIPLLGWVVGLVVVCFSILSYLGWRFEYYPGDLIDARLCMYFLEHGYKLVSAHLYHSFFDAPFFYPARGVLGYSENFLGHVPFYSPWRFLGFDRETSFQFWVALGFILNYFSAAWVFHKLRFHLLGILSGAYVFAFSQAAVAQIGHSQLIYRFPVPLAWYFLYRFLERFSWRALLKCCFFLAWQVYLSIYEGYFLAVFLLIVAIVTTLGKTVLREYIRQSTRATILAHACILLSFGASVGVLLRPYIHSAADPASPEVRRNETISMLPRPASYLISWPGNYETGWLYERADVPMRHEHTMFVGLIPWACVLFLILTARRPGRNPEVFPALFAMLGIIAVTLYVHGMSLYLMVMRIPGVLGIRGVTRWIVILVLPFALAVAQVVHICHQNLKGRGQPVIAVLTALLAVGILFENHISPYRFSKSEAQQRLQKLQAQLPSALPSDAILAYLSSASEPERQQYELDAMLLAQDNNKFTLNGYSSRAPRGYRSLRTCSDLKHDLNDIADQNDAFALRDTAAQAVIIGTAPDGPCTHLNAPSSIQTERLPDRAFRAQIAIRTPPEVPVNSNFSVLLQVTNQSNVPWRARALDRNRYAVLAACRWIDAVSQQPVTGYDNRFELPYDLPPGETASIYALLSTPATPGEYLIGCDLVQELVHWFHDLGSSVGTSEVVVTGTGGALEGFLDRADARRIAGWVWEPAHPDRVLQVKIYDGETLLARLPARTFRQDLLSAGKGNGAYGFDYPNPSTKTGTHVIRASVSGRNFDLIGSPKTVIIGR